MHVMVLFAMENIDYVGCDYETCLPFRLLLEGQDGHTWNDHMCYYTTYHFPNVGGQIDPSLIVVPNGPWCMLCM